MSIKINGNWDKELSVEEVGYVIGKQNLIIDNLNEELFKVVEFLSKNKDLNNTIKNILLDGKRKLISSLEYETSYTSKLNDIYHLLECDVNVILQQYQEYVLDYSTIEDIKAGKVALD